ncbi:hypothetical protein [Synechococcus sp. MU1642]|uniref:hypothetical protein n=1 Tax=Synechococcus sp. MU1642 TaxID=2508348 RepID=UPI001CF81143|nr:hypothetical protein [Synechococcus sp. MU1642]MCB4408263.1 PCRF domain-containing protein [Synechococcus sp. MU1642]
MQRLIPLLCLGVTSVGITSCGLVSFSGDQPKANTRASIKQLERRINQLEQELKSPAGDADSKTPAGPLRSLTLRIGTEDDRLRMYWADGQTSNLICSVEGKGVWACG